MSNTGQNIKDEAIRETAFGSVTSSYVALGSALLHDAFRITLVNDTDTNVYVSLDGSTDNKKIPTKSDRIYDDKTNDMYRKKDTQFYIKDDGSAATEDAVWLEVEYV